MTWKQSVRKLKQAFKSRVVDDNGPGSSRGDFSGIFPPAAAGFGAGAAAAAAAAAADAVADAAAALDSLDRVCDRTLGILASLGQGAGLPSWVRVRDRTLCCHAVGDAGN